MGPLDTAKGVLFHLTSYERFDLDNGEFEEEENYLYQTYQKKKITFINWCFMCKSSGEEGNDLFLHCQIAFCLWWKILRWFGLQMMMSSTIK